MVICMLYAVNEIPSFLIPYSFILFYLYLIARILLVHILVGNRSGSTAIE